MRSLTLVKLSLTAASRLAAIASPFFAKAQFEFTNSPFETQLCEKCGLALTGASGSCLFRGSLPGPASFHFGFQREAEERPNYDNQA